MDGDCKEIQDRTLVITMVRWNKIEYGNSPFVDEDIDMDEKLKSLFSQWEDHNKAELTDREWLAWCKTKKETKINDFISDIEGRLLEMIK